MSNQLFEPDSEFSQDSSLGLTFQVLDSLGSEGLAITPFEPSETMLCAGASAGGVSPETAKRVYQVMLQTQE